MSKCDCKDCEFPNLSEAIRQQKERIEECISRSQVQKILLKISSTNSLFIMLDWEPSEECLKAFQNHGLIVGKTSIKSGDDTRWDLLFL